MMFVSQLVSVLTELYRLNTRADCAADVPTVNTGAVLKRSRRQTRESHQILRFWGSVIEALRRHSRNSRNCGNTFVHQRQYPKKKKSITDNRSSKETEHNDIEDYVKSPPSGLKKVPPSGLKKVPLSGLKKVPLSGLKKFPLSGLKKFPLSGLKKFLLSGLNKVPLSGLNRFPPSGLKKFPPKRAKEVSSKRVKEGSTKWAKEVSSKRVKEGSSKWAKEVSSKRVKEGSSKWAIEVSSKWAIEVSSKRIREDVTCRSDGQPDLSRLLDNKTPSRISRQGHTRRSSGWLRFESFTTCAGGCSHIAFSLPLSFRDVIVMSHVISDYDSVMLPCALFYIRATSFRGPLT
uniref:Uncharacterized protein n=1 Tax=Timema douglasi TaxID=61478 RepID=A0A7R8VDS2_TIMDO|nr:unnamed protein product [Timema douglasi]